MAAAWRGWLLHDPMRIRPTFRCTCCGWAWWERFSAFPSTRHCSGSIVHASFIRPALHDLSPKFHFWTCATEHCVFLIHGLSLYPLRFTCFPAPPRVYTRPPPLSPFSSSSITTNPTHPTFLPFPFLYSSYTVMTHICMVHTYTPTSARNYSCSLQLYTRTSLYLCSLF